MTTFVTINDENSFPITSANIAENVARPLGKFGFGVEKDRVSKALRSLADSIDADELLPQALTHSTSAACDEFVMHELALKFAAYR